MHGGKGVNPTLLRASPISSRAAWGDWIAPGGWGGGAAATLRNWAGRRTGGARGRRAGRGAHRSPLYAFFAGGGDRQQNSRDGVRRKNASGGRVPRRSGLSSDGRESARTDPVLGAGADGQLNRRGRAAHQAGGGVFPRELRASAPNTPRMPDG